MTATHAEAQSLSRAIRWLLEMDVQVTESRARALARMLRWRARMDCGAACPESVAAMGTVREMVEGWV